MFKSSMKEYFIEDDKEVDLSKLKAAHLNNEDYAKAHQNLVIPCHDVFIQYGKGILLVTRDNLPMKGILWPVGGRMQRGVPTEESLKHKVKLECNLDITKLKYLGYARQFMATDPFSHGNGTDTTAVVYFAIGKGELKLDNLHKEPKIITPEEYPIIRSQLHPYVRDFLDEAIKLVS